MRYILAVVVLLHACDSDTSGPTPAELCACLVDEVGNACERCGPGTYQGCADLLLAQVKGGCANVVGVRDRAAFTEQCLPWWRSLSCESGPPTESHPSCRMQLQIR